MTITAHDSFDAKWTIDDHARERTARLFRSYVSRIHNYLSSRVRRADLADDLTQIVFLKVLKHFAAGRATPLRVAPWLYTIASNVCKDHWRDAGRYGAMLDGHVERVPAAVAPAGEIFTALKETLHLVDGALITRVNQEQRAALMLVYCKGASITDAAAALRVPRNTIKSRCKRGVAAVVAETVASDRPLSEDETRAALTVLSGMLYP